MAVTKRLRYEILRRDNHQCRYCHATDVPLTIDHVVPVALGGSDAPGNLVAACKDCNAGKSASSPDAPIVADVEQDALRWSNAMKRVADIAKQKRLDDIDLVERWVNKWNEWLNEWDDDAHPLPNTFPHEIMQFLNLGLTIGDLVSFIPIAMRKHMASADRWAYFRGICWRTLDQRREQAQQLLRAEEST